MPLLVGVFSEPGPVAEAAKRLRGRGIAKIEIYSPAAFPELDNALDEKPSKVRWFTLIGGLLGVTAGYTLAIWMSVDWPIIVGGKPPASVAPYTVIGFELTILFGALATLLGLLIVGKLPYGSFGKGDKGYNPRFSAEEIGLVVDCSERDVAEVDALLRAHHAQEVSLVEA
jgi:hypothetical protein